MKTSVTGVTGVTSVRSVRSVRKKLPLNKKLPILVTLDSEVTKIDDIFSSYP